MRSNDFIYNPRVSSEAPYGPVNLNELSGIGIVSPLYNVLKAKDEKYLLYMKYYFKSSLWYRELYKISNQGARHDRMAFLKKDFLNILVFVPDSDLTHKIGNLLYKIDKLINNQNKKLNAFEMIKRSYLQSLFS